MPDEIFAVMAAFQPYKGGNALLYALNQLRNTNAHELLAPVVAHSAGYQGREVTITGPLSLSVGKWDSAKQELEVARIGPGGKLNGYFEFSFYVALGDVECVRGEPAVGVLRAMVGEVERVLMALETEARRLSLLE